MKNRIVLLLLIGLPIVGVAQGTTVGDFEVRTKEIYKPSISDAFKINDQPQLADTTAEKPKLTYAIRKVSFENKFETEEIKPARIKETVSKIYPNYAKIGLGNYGTIYGEAFINSKRSSKYQYGLHLRHKSSTGGIKDKAPSGYIDDNIDLYGKRMYKGFNLSAGLDFSHDRVHFYGPADEDVDKKDIRRTFRSYGAHISYAGTKEKLSALIDKASFSYYHLEDLENRFTFKSEISSLLKGEVFEMGLDADISDYQGSTAGVLSLTPKIIAERGRMNFILGLGFYGISNSGLDNFSGTQFAPIVDFKYTLFEDVLIANAGINGGARLNGSRDLLWQNPFSNNPAGVTRETLKIHFGLNGALSSNITFNVEGGLRKVKDLANFANVSFYNADSSDVVSNMVVDYSNTDIFYLNAELLYQKEEQYAIGLVSKMQSFENSEIYHIPSFKMGLTGSYNLSDKILFNAELYYVGTRNATEYSISPTDELVANDIKLDAYFDANLGIEYRYSKVLSAYVNFTNFTNTDYDLWYQYTAQGFGVLGGFSYRF